VRSLLLSDCVAITIPPCLHWSADLIWNIAWMCGRIGGHLFDIILDVFAAGSSSLRNGWCVAFWQTQIEHLLTVYTGQPDILCI